MLQYFILFANSFIAPLERMVVFISMVVCRWRAADYFLPTAQAGEFHGGRGVYMT